MGVFEKGKWPILWRFVRSIVVSTLSWFVAEKLGGKVLGTWRCHGYRVLGLGDSGRSTKADKDGDRRDSWCISR